MARHSALPGAHFACRSRCRAAHNRNRPVDRDRRGDIALFHRIAAALTIILCTLGGLAASAANAPDTRPAIVYATPAVPDNMDPDHDAGSVSTASTRISTTRCCNSIRTRARA